MTRLLSSSQAPGWPLAVLFLGLPVWWVLGVWQLMFFVLALPMAAYLMKQRKVTMPRGFGIWLLWLGWLLTGLMVMQVDAPGAVPGSSAARYLTFGYRFGWYVVATIVALYILNTPRRLSTEKVARSLAWLFVMLVAGGLLGLLLPTLHFPSVLQMALPGGVGRHPFVHDLVHVQVAQVQTVLGDPQPRPSAPFAYTNEWGLVTACTLPFFVTAWWNRGRAWRIGLVGVMAVAMFTIVASLNRGTWVAIAVMATFVVIRSALRGRVKLLVAATLLVLVLGAALLVTPMGDLVTARFDNPHSDEGRANLGTLAVQSAAEGSPVVGFGTTREVAGNFSSIAGGATADCPKCAPPPLGSHGQLWLTIFGAGFVGAALYTGFLVSQILVGLRARSPYAVAASCTLVTLTITMPIYPAVGVALYIGFIAVAVLARHTRGVLPTLEATARPVMRQAPVVALGVILGVAVALGVHSFLGAPVQATQRLLVPGAGLVAVPSARPFTLDGEALLATSAPVIRAVSDGLDVSEEAAQAALAISAEPNTRVLLVSYQDRSAERAIRGAELAAAAYLSEREALLTAASASIEERYLQRQRDLGDIYRTSHSIAATAPWSPMWTTITEVRGEASRTGDILLRVDEADVGQPLAGAFATASRDQFTIRVASGLALGGLLGVPAAWGVDRYLLRLGRRAPSRLSIPVPVVARVATNDLAGTVQAVHGYLPVAGVIADSTSREARQMTTRLDSRLPTHGHGGSRALLVVGERSRASSVRRLYDQCIHSGVHPVGLIVCEAHAKHRNERADL